MPTRLLLPAPLWENTTSSKGGQASV